MRKPNVTPQSSEREFKSNELFFSTTDKKGIIESGNEVFTRVAGFSLEELLGQPHNIIRHPDMPCAVFRLLWTYLFAGKTIAAYVKNMARDGRYYWVIALVIPIGNRFLSVRFKPSSQLLPVVEKLYTEMRQLEIACEQRGEDADKAMDASTNHLVAALGAAGFVDYDAFMRTFIREELKSRDARIAQEMLTIVPQLPDRRNVLQERRGQVTAITSIYEACRQTYQHLNNLFGQLDDFVVLNEELEKKSKTVLGLTKDFRFISLNTAIKSSKLGEWGSSLGVIAQYLGESSTGISGIVSGLTTKIRATADKLRSVIFNLAGARLETEMIMVFCHELILQSLTNDQSVAASTLRRKMIEDLKAAFAFTIDQTVGALNSLGDELSGLDEHSDQLRKTLLTLQFTQLGGMVEAYRLDQGATFGIIFQEVRKQLESTKSELSELSSIIQQLTELVIDAPQITAVLASTVKGIDEQISMISAS